jgi:hypothetical protein
MALLSPLVSVQEAGKPSSFAIVAANDDVVAHDDGVYGALLNWAVWWRASAASLQTELFLRCFARDLP